MGEGTYAQNGIYTISGIDYAFDQNGWMVTGWYQDDNENCYYAGNGLLIEQ